MAARRVTRRAATVEARPVGADVELSEELGGAGEDSGARAAPAQRVGYAPIVRLDAARRELELCATSEAVDSYGTIFDYKASKDAFARWIGNVREMHERKAVGQRVGVRFDDAGRKVFVTIRISRGAQDTWEKVLDGTLRGASIGAANVEWQPTLWPVGAGQKSLLKAEKYDLVELSLVDNPSNPDALGFTFVRDAVPDLGMLDRLEEFTAEVAEGAEQTQRGGESEAESLEDALGSPTGIRAVAMERERMAPTAGAASSEGRRADAAVAPPRDLVTASDRWHMAARAILAGCGCELCEAALAALADDMDAAMGELEEEVGGSEAQTVRLREAAFARALGASLRVSLRGSARRLDALDAGMREVQRAVEEDSGYLMRISAQVSQVASSMADSVAGAMRRMGELGERLERLEAQPMPGGPAARAVEKTHPLHQRDRGVGQSPSADEQYRALEALAGRLADPQAQIAVAAELIRMQRER